MRTCTVDPLGTGNHSDDLIQVWHGRPEPTYVCGYHYQNWPGSLEEIEDARPYTTRVRES